MRKKAYITVQEMEIDDIPVVFAIGEKVFTSEYSNIYRSWDEYEVTNAYTSEGELSLVAVLDDKTVGFAIGTLIEKGTAWNYGHLLWLGVDPEYKRMGVGSKLLSEMKRRFIKDGARIMFVDTQVENADAVAFFQRHGLKDRSDHVYLSCHLTDKKPRKKSRKNPISLSKTLRGKRKN